MPPRNCEETAVAGEDCERISNGSAPLAEPIFNNLVAGLGAVVPRVIKVFLIRLLGILRGISLAFWSTWCMNLRNICAITIITS